MSGPIFSVAWETGWPGVDELGAEIQRLQRERDEMIIDRLSGRTRTDIGNGFEIVTDPSMPPGVVELRESSTGIVLGKIVNVDS